jgi:hypothetical protein
MPEVESYHLCSGTIFGRGSSFRAANMLSKTIKAILFRLSQVLANQQSGGGERKVRTQYPYEVVA